MSLQKQIMQPEELDRLLGARVVHIERVPTADGSPGGFQWVLSLRELPAEPGVSPYFRHLGADVPCTCPERPCPRASVLDGGQRPMGGWGAQLEEPKYVTIDKMA